jgi:hypothetical protein
LVQAAGRLALAAVAAGAIGLAFPGAAVAEGCAPLGGAPGFRPLQAPEQRAYDVIEFTVLRDGSPAVETVSGAKCYQVYVADADAGGTGVPELQALYRDRLERIGARILFTDRHRLYAQLSAAGHETWFRVHLQDREIDVTVVRKQALAPSLTRPSGHDHRLLGHMPHYEEVSSTKHTDEMRPFTVFSGGDLRTVAIRGAVYDVAYRAKSRDRLSSDAEIQENYRAALRALGADILFTDWRTTIARHAERGRMVWLRVTSQISEIAVLAVEAKLPPPQLRFSDRVLAAALAQDGRVTAASGLGVGNAPMRTDRSLVRQIVALLRRDRNLALEVIAHTDNLGGRDANRKRSQVEAEAIAAAVVNQGIARDRIDATGAGPDRPLADNATVEGRARNRRIELVRKRVPPPPLPRRRPDQ